MIWGFEPPKSTACMACRKSLSRYYGNWGGEGLCRPCIEAMPPEDRLKVIRDLHPEDRSRWRLDNLGCLNALYDRSVLPSALGLRLEPGSSQVPSHRPTEGWDGARRPVPSASPGKALHPERRRQPRRTAKLPVGVTYPGPPSAAGSARPKAAHSMSSDLSVGGIRVAVQSPDLLDLALGTQLRVEFLLPNPSFIVRCAGVVKSVVASRRGAELGHLGVAFREVGPAQEASLRQFVSSLPAAP